MCETLIIDLIGFSLTFAMHARIGSLQLPHLPFDKSRAQCFSPYKEWDFLHIYTQEMNRKFVRSLRALQKAIVTVSFKLISNS